MRQTEKSEKTRAALVAAARQLFAERGYAEVGTAEIVTLAASSRGAMYHHFVDKQDLFRAVYERVQQELISQVLGELVADEDPLSALVRALRAFLTACLQPERARIGLIDAPAVLGWRDWRELDEEYALGGVIAALEAGMAAGVLRTDVSVNALAHMVLAALGEAGLMIASSDDPAATRSESELALLALLDGLRTDRRTPGAPRPGAT